MPLDAAGLLEEGRHALGSGDIPAAAAAFEAALSLEDSPLVRTMLAAVRYVDDDLEQAREQWECAFTLYLRRGDRAAAARVAASLSDLHAAGLGNLATGRGWVRRGRRLLEGRGRCVELGYLELAMVACLRDDMLAVERSADAALALAVEFQDSALELRALADGGLALVTQGRDQEGFARQALATMSSGQVQDLAVLGKSLCALLSACDRAGYLGRAEECTRVVEKLLIDRLGGRPRMLRTHCRAVYGAVLCSIGEWAEGEQVLTEALGRGSSASVYHRMLTSCHLADLRVMQGRLAEAGDLLQPWTGLPDAASPLARLHLAAGEPDLAAATAAGALTVLHADVLRATPLRSVLVEAELARGHPSAAAAAAAAAWEAAETTTVPAVRAEVLLARARVAVATGDATAAVEHLGRARAELGEEHLPMLRAAIGHTLAAALADSGAPDVAIAEGRAALAVFHRLGARPDAQRTSALLRRLGAPAHPIRTVVTDPDPMLTDREREVLALLEEGLTNSEIGQRLYVTTKTVEHHIGSILSKLGVHSRAQAVRSWRLRRTPLPANWGGGGQFPR